MRVLDLFSGIGGFSLGLERAGMRTVAFCEIDPYCRAVLRKHWPTVPIFTDVRELDCTRAVGIDVICGGFPCQPHSSAGNRRGKEDDRHLWPEMFRIIEEARPSWVLAENVAGIISVELDQVLADLEGLGYSCGAADIPAVAVDAPHARHRWWIVGHANGSPENTHASAGASSKGREATCEPSRWPAEPGVGRTSDGLSNRLDTYRLSGLGNAVIPKIPEIIGRAIMKGYA